MTGSTTACCASPTMTRPRRRITSASCSNDLGEDESTLKEEEKAALEEAGVPLDLDVFRLKRDYVETYLRENLWLALSNLEPLADPPGTYLEAFDAWYQSHGDTAMQTYVFDSGTVALDGTVTPLLYRALSGYPR